MATNLDVKKVQMILNLPQDGILGSNTQAGIKNVQAKNGLAPTGTLDNNTLALFKRKWPYAWGLSGVGAVVQGPQTYNGQPLSYGQNETGFLPEQLSGIMGMVINGVLLYGLFKVFMKVF